MIVSVKEGAQEWYCFQECSKMSLRYWEISCANLAQKMTITYEWAATENGVSTRRSGHPVSETWMVERA